MSIIKGHTVLDLIDENGDYTESEITAVWFDTEKITHFYRTRLILQGKEHPGTEIFFEGGESFILLMDSKKFAHNVEQHRKPHSETASIWTRICRAMGWTGSDSGESGATSKRWDSQTGIPGDKGND